MTASPTSQAGSFNRLERRERLSCFMVVRTVEFSEQNNGDSGISVAIDSSNARCEKLYLWVAKISLPKCLLRPVAIALSLVAYPLGILAQHDCEIT